MQKQLFLAIILFFCLGFSVYSMQFELTGGIAIDSPISKPLPGLKTGYGWAFSMGFLPYEKFGLSFGISSTLHDFNAGAPDRIVSGDSRRNTLYGVFHYRLLQVGKTEFEAYVGGSYNSINGGDSSGGHLNLGDINKDDIGYSGFGGLIGAGVLRQIGSGYSVNLNVKYVDLTYSKHQFPILEFAGQDNHAKGNSLMINLVIVYRVDFIRF